jgi:hypothetical protein
VHINVYSSPGDNPAIRPTIEEIYHSTASKSMHFIIGVGSISGEEMLVKVGKVGLAQIKSA